MKNRRKIVFFCKYSEPADSFKLRLSDCCAAAPANFVYESNSSMTRKELVAGPTFVFWIDARSSTYWVFVPLPLTPSGNCVMGSRFLLVYSTIIIKGVRYETNFGMTYGLKWCTENTLGKMSNLATEDSILEDVPVEACRAFISIWSWLFPCLIESLFCQIQSCDFILAHVWSLSYFGYQTRFSVKHYTSQHYGIGIQHRVELYLAMIMTSFNF